MGINGPLGPGGFRRRGRRRGLVVGAAVGAAAANRKQRQSSGEPEDATDYEVELTDLSKLKAENLITDEEYEAKRKQILGL